MNYPPGIYSGLYLSIPVEGRKKKEGGVFGTRFALTFAVAKPIPQKDLTNARPKALVFFRHYYAIPAI